MHSTTHSGRIGQIGDPRLREWLAAEWKAASTGKNFGLVQGDLDARVSVVDGVARGELSWSGFDEDVPMRGHGWMAVTGFSPKLLAAWPRIHTLARRA